MDQDRRRIDVLVLSRSWVWGLPVLPVVALALLQKPFGVATTFLILGAVAVAAMIAVVAALPIMRRRSERARASSTNTDRPDTGSSAANQPDLATTAGSNEESKTITCLRGADLTGAVLADADLQDADLRGAVLDRADLQRANLRGAKLGPLPPSDA